MLNKNESRLGAVYRSVDDCLMGLADVSFLEDYISRGLSGELGQPEIQRRILAAAQNAALLCNRLAAVYRDVACLDDSAPRVKINAETGAPELDHDWGEASLRAEVLYFLGAEAAAVEQVVGNQ